MTEKEIREVIRELCDELDQSARRMVKQGLRKVVLPTVLGAGLALSVGGCGDRTTPGQQDHHVSAADMAYGVPMYMAPMDRGPDKVPQPVFEYGVQHPDYNLGKQDHGPTPPYMPPFVDKSQAKIDGGSAILYSVVMPDSKP